MKQLFACDDGSSSSADPFVLPLLPHRLERAREMLDVCEAFMIVSGRDLKTPPTLSHESMPSWRS